MHPCEAKSVPGWAPGRAESSGSGHPQSGRPGAAAPELPAAWLRLEVCAAISVLLQLTVEQKSSCSHHLAALGHWLRPRVPPWVPRPPTELLRLRSGCLAWLPRPTELHTSQEVGARPHQLQAVVLGRALGFSGPVP